jgi:transcriptional regulator with XRE-family HTH domain
MNVHRNAKTTVKMRQLIATRARQGWTYAQIAHALGLSVRTVAKWQARAVSTRWPIGRPARSASRAARRRALRR